MQEMCFTCSCSSCPGSERICLSLFSCAFPSLIPIVLLNITRCLEAARSAFTSVGGTEGRRDEGTDTPPQAARAEAIHEKVDVRQAGGRGWARATPPGLFKAARRRARGSDGRRWPRREGAGSVPGSAAHRPALSRSAWVPLPSPPARGSLCWDFMSVLCPLPW